MESLSAIKYAVKLIGGLTLIISLNTILTVSSYRSLLLSNTPTELAKIIPASISVLIQNGAMMVNVDKPVYVPLAKIKTATKFIASHPQLKYLIIFDTSASTSDYYRLHSAVLVTREDLILPLGHNQMLAIPLKFLPSVQFNQTQLASWLSILQPWIKWSFIITPFIWLIVWVLVSILFLVSMLLLTLLVWVGGKLFGSVVSGEHNFRIMIRSGLITCGCLYLLSKIGTLDVLLPLSIFVMVLTNLIMQLQLTINSITPNVSYSDRQ